MFLTRKINRENYVFQKKMIKFDQILYTTKINKKNNWKINRIRPLLLPKNVAKKTCDSQKYCFFNKNNKTQYQ